MVKQINYKSIALVFYGLAIAFFGGYAQENTSKPAMESAVQPTLVLVHGSYHGSWCWERLVPILERKGVRVIAPDAKGRGKESQDYVSQVEEVLSRETEPVVLLGHSSGGMVLSELAKRQSGKIKSLVYLSAFLLPEGVFPPVVMKSDTVSLFPYSLLTDRPTGRTSIKKDAARELFYADCSDSVADWAISMLSSEPGMPENKPAAARASLPVQRGATIPRYYIETVKDKALGISTQRKMYHEMPCRKVYSLNTGHSPFLSAPDKLAAIILEIVTQNP
jgi:pimeloyl-ACP methyl ester carboxylesterase